MLSAVILAAGQSSRMGNSIKALLTVDGVTFLEKIINNISETDVGEIVVVLGAHFKKIIETLHLENIKVVRNEDWKKGQLSSLRAGIKNLAGRSQGVLFTLVDHPLVKKTTYRRLVEVWKKDRTKIVVPSYRGRKGHPAIFPEVLYDKVLNEELPDGARGIIKKEIESVKFVPVQDGGVVEDIDTINDYKRLTGGQ